LSTSGDRGTADPRGRAQDFAELSAEVVDKLQIDLYSEPAKAALNALAEI